MLEQKDVSELVAPGKHPVGAHGLYVQVMGGSKTYLWRGRLAGKRVDRGLGAVAAVTLADALARAQEFEAGRVGEAPSRAAMVAAPLVDGLDDMPTFGQALELMFEGLRRSHKVRSVRSMKLADSMVARYLLPQLGDMPVAAVTVRDVRAVLEPMRYEVPSVADRVANHMSRTFAWAMAMGYCESNPADGKVLEMALPRARVEVTPRRAAAWQEFPAAYAQLALSSGLEELGWCLRFQALTLVRPGEARAALWEEVDLDAGLWSIPAGRMKMRRPFQVPLSQQAVAVLRDAALRRPGCSGLVFPHPHTGAMLSASAPTARLGYAGLGHLLTAHGVRSSGRSWMADTMPELPWEVAEMCLAHQVGTAVSRAYMRSDYLEQRRPVMEAWGKYVESALSCELVDNNGGGTSVAPGRVTEGSW